MRKLLLFLLCSSVLTAETPVETILAPAGFAPEAKYPIRAYSEYMPGPRVGVLPYEARTIPRATLLRESRWASLFGDTKGDKFLVPLLDERTQLQPALQHLAEHWLTDLRQLETGQGDTRGIHGSVLKDNPYYVATQVKGKLPLVSFTSLTLSRSQDMDGKNPWTVYGGMDLVPGADEETIFWKSLPNGKGVEWIEALLGKLKAGASFHVLTEKKVPAEFEEHLYKKGAAVKTLVTFLPPAKWPEKVRKNYDQGKVLVLPHPSTLIFTGSPVYRALAKLNPEALQLPLGREFTGFAGYHGALVLKVRPLNDDDRWRRRQHRFSKKKTVEREDNDAPALSPFQLIFDAIPEVIGLYGKPVARNTQIWSETEWVLNGPTAGMEQIEEARDKVSRARQGQYAYREYFPPLQVNGFDLRWYRPLVAWQFPKETEAKVDFDLMGAVRASRGGETVWLTPEVIDIDGLETELAEHPAELDGKKIFEMATLLGGKVTEDLASSLVTSTYPAAVEPGGFAEWKVKAAKLVPGVVEKVSKVVSGRTKAEVPLTYGHTVTASYEKDYWKGISDLVEFYSAKNNIDCADHEKKDGHCEENELYLVSRKILRKHYEALGLQVFEHTFRWEVDFKIPWWGGLDKDKPHHNLIAVIPGTGDHSEAVIMGDHFDTAFMADIYRGDKGKEFEGHRHAAPGADDNHSATSALMEAARVLLKLKLKHDVWLVHLTGEEFPADCLGARYLSEALITGKPVIPGRKNPKIRGLYVLDMVAHNTDRDHVKPGAFAPSIFQISPGRGERSARLAQVAHEATIAWNASAPAWDAKFGRKPFWERSKTKAPPRQGLFPRFRGEVRPWWHYRSSLFNTDGQIFSDAGIPVVLLMENYDINRNGYHDTLDTLANIDLDYGAGLTRIAIESVAQLAK